MSSSPNTQDVQQNTTCPSIEELASLLDSSQDSIEGIHEGSEAELLRHISDCSTCLETLEWMGGEEIWWEQARQSLSSTICDTERFSKTTGIVESICALSNSKVLTSDDPLCAHEIEQLTSLLDPASHPELLGRIGRYEVEQLVGRGGMGLVFRGYDTELHRVVAIKTLAIHLVPVSSARERFVREGRACASLIHPHIVPVHDVITDGPVPALVMQFVAGPTLDGWLQKHGPMSFRQAVGLMMQLSEALVSAHEKGFVHRDIKPGNVLLEAEGSRAMLADFGLVRTLDDATLTRSGMLAGTPDFMSPEQARGESVDSRSDLFSLGSLFYTMLAGKPPFQAPEPMAVMNQICHESHLPISDLIPAVPKSIASLIDQLLHKDPSKRMSSARDLFEALRRERIRLQEGPEERASSHKSIWKQIYLTLPVLVVLCGIAIWAVQPWRTKTPDLSNELRPDESTLAEALAQEYFADSVERESQASDSPSLLDVDKELDELRGAVDAMLIGVELSVDVQSVMPVEGAKANVDLQIDALTSQIESLQQQLDSKSLDASWNLKSNTNDSDGKKGKRDEVD